MPRFRTKPAAPPRQAGSLPGQQGVTIIELLVTISIVAILLGLAVPSYRDFIVGNRISTYSNDLMASLNLARSEAIKRGDMVVVCKSSDGASCTGNWSDGWIVFVDSNSDGSVTVGETIVRVHEALASNYTLNSTATAFSTRVRFDHLGTIPSAGSGGGSFLLCASGQLDSHSKAIVITRTRLRLGTATSCS